MKAWLLQRSGAVRTATAAPKVRRVVHRLRTEGAGPYRETAAIAIGVFVGCTPLYGLHFLICWVLALVLRLNRVKVYLAANLSNPLLAPFLVFTELQVGAWLRHGRMHALKIETVAAASPWSFGLDLIVGSLAVGGVLATGAGALTYLVVRRASEDAVFGALVRQAADRYIASSITAWEFARGKLRGDPVYKTVLEGGLLRSGGTLVDIGCGQGLMMALLIEAKERVRSSTWPSGRPAPPLFDRLVGVETRPRTASVGAVCARGRRRHRPGGRRRSEDRAMHGGAAVRRPSHDVERRPAGVALAGESGDRCRRSDPGTRGR